MNPDAPFYVRRIECWGGTYRYCVADSRDRKQVSEAFEKRGRAEKLVERKNKDFARYRRAMLEKAS